MDKFYLVIISVRDEEAGSWTNPKHIQVYHHRQDAVRYMEEIYQSAEKYSGLIDGYERTKRPLSPTVAYCTGIDTVAGYASVSWCTPFPGPQVEVRIIEREVKM